MKKRIAVAMVLVILLSVCVGTLAGCDEIIKLNEERDANQVVASVSYAGQTAYVYKYELSISFNSYAYVYHNYYGLSYEAAADYLLQSLAQRELLVLFAKDELVRRLNEEDGGSRTAATTDIADLLSGSELNRAIENVNDDLLSSVNSALESLINLGNNSSTDGSGSADEYEEYTGSDAITVRFDSQGGSSVDRQRIKSGTTAFEPDDPTYDGYTFYGWYTDAACTDGNEFDFSTVLTESTTLYAKWVEYTEPRPVREETAEDPDADYDPDYDLPEAEWSPRALDENGRLTDAYRALITSGEVELDCLSSYSSAKKAEYLEQYLDSAVEDVADDLDSLHTSYDYYYQNELKTLLITKLERVIGSSASVTDEEVLARFESLVAKNKETFSDDASYETALTDALATTYYHRYTSPDSRYGFVANILLRMSDDDLAILTQMVEDGSYNGNTYVIEQKRDELLNAMSIKVSNPDYDPDYVCDNHTCESGSDCDPMTCPNHSCINDEPTVTGKGYNQIIDFAYNAETESFEIVYNVTVCPAMAYLPDEVPAFGSGDTVGIVQQIYNSLKAITDATVDGIDGHVLSKVESVYWIREMATAWLYLVGDDTGSTSSDSNNGGLGYLVAPEDAETDISYIDAFNEQGRALIKNGTGSYVRNAADGAAKDNFYVFGDNFIESGSTSSAYAGIFILVCTYVPYDTNAWVPTFDDDGNVTGERQLTADDFTEEGVLPLDYVVEYGATLEECVTIRQQIEETILTSKQAALYEEAANAFGVENYQNISYNRSAYESLWKDLD